MKFFIAVSALLALAVAKPSGIITPVAPAVYTVSAAVPAAVSSQFHSQDELGQYSYGYANPLSSKIESRAIDGTTVGGYSYVDGLGKIQSVEYTADGLNGFRVAASNLPVAPAIPEVPAIIQPVPVQDTPEVAEAKAKHLAAFEEVKARAAELVVPSVELKSVLAPAVGFAPILPAATAVFPSVPALALKSAVEVAAPAVEAKSAAPAPAPAIETKSAVVPAEEPKPAADPAAVPAVEVKSAAAPAIEVKSALPAVEIKAAPAVAVKSIVAPAVAVRSFVSPSIAVKTAPVLTPAFGYSYGINTIHGYNTYLAEPLLTTYAAHLAPQFYAAPVHSTLIQKTEGWEEKRSQ